MKVTLESTDMGWTRLGDLCADCFDAIESQAQALVHPARAERSTTNVAATPPPVGEP